MKRVLFVVPGSPFFPSGIVRVEQYLERLRADGIDAHVLTYFSPAAERLKQQKPAQGAAALTRQLIANLLSAAHVWAARAQIMLRVRRVDAVVVQKVLLPLWLTDWIARRTERLVFDFDDAIHLVAPARTDEIVRRAWRVVAGSHALYEYALERNASVVLVPSSVAVERFGVDAPASDAPREHDARAPLRDVPCIGWIGSFGTLSQLTPVAAALQQLAREGVRFELLLAGTQRRDDLLPDLSGVAVRAVASYTAADLPALVAALDVGIMPLEDTPWMRGKCAMKALLYMAGAKPVVLSPVGENCHVVRDGETGFFANSTAEWVDRLRRLLADPALRARMGRRGRALVAERYSTSASYASLWTSVFSQL